MSPEIRYTRWAADNVTNGANTGPNQIELLMGFSYGRLDRFQPFGKRLSIGAVVGVNLLPDYRRVSPVTFGPPTDPLTSTYRSGAHSFLVGPLIDIPLGPLSLEASAS